MKLENFRIFLASWLILPFVLVWLSTNYLIGLNRRPVWQMESNPKENQVLAQTTHIAENDIEKIHWKGEGMVTLWFDDAWTSQFTVAMPLLEEKHMVGALAVPTGMIGFDDYMSWNQVKLLEHKGWEITSHTIHHSCDENELTDEYIEQELKGAEDELNAHGIRALHFVTPCGTKSDKITEIAKKYYLSLRTTEDGFNELPVTNPYHLKVQAVEWNTSPEKVAGWVKEASEKHYWLILMFHQVQETESRFAVTPQNLSRILDTIQESGLKTVLPTQATQLILDQEISYASGEADTSEVEPTPAVQEPFVTMSSGLIQISKTPNGFLRVRKEPSLSSETVFKAKDNQAFPLLESIDGWYKIEVDSESKLEGWVSAQYATKLES